MPDPINRLADNLADVARLMEIHAETTGTDRGRRTGVEVLNKSGIVLAVACWEAFAEDCATDAFDFVVANVNDPSVLPTRARQLVAKAVREDKNDLAPWNLAGIGWKDQMKKHRDSVLRRYVSPLNTPRAEQVDALFSDLIDLPKVSDSWTWHRSKADRSRQELSDIITMRGSIAHRVAPDKPVQKVAVERAVEFIGYVANLTSNRVRDHVHGIVGKHPWVARPTPGRPGRPLKSSATAPVV